MSRNLCRSFYPQVENDIIEILEDIISNIEDSDFNFDNNKNYKNFSNENENTIIQNYSNVSINLNNSNYFSDKTLLNSFEASIKDKNDKNAGSKNKNEESKKSKKSSCKDKNDKKCQSNVSKSKVEVKSQEDDSVNASHATSESENNQSYLKFPITNLTKSFRQAISQDNSLISISDKSADNFTICCLNPGGLQSKYLTVENLAIRNQVDAIVVSETHFSGKRKPFVSRNYTAYFKNRSKFKKSCKGGIAIFLKKEIAEHAVMMEVGDNNEEEFVCVKVNCYEPPLLIFAAYGPQQSKKRDEVTGLWIKYFGLWKRYKDLGYTVMACGDFNAAVGNQLGLVNNHPSVNLAGKLLVEEVTELGWEIVNKMDKDSDQRTHVDRSTSDSSRCLDYIVTNRLDLCLEAKIDNDLLATPYNVITQDGFPHERKYADHKTVMAVFDLKKIQVKTFKQPTKFIKDANSRAKFHLETDEIAEKGLQMLAGDENPTKIVNMIDRQIKRAHYKCHKVLKPNKPAEITEDDAIFWNLTNQLEKEVENLENMKVDYQIYNVRMKGLLSERGDPLFSMKTKTGDIADTKEMIEDVLLRHNQDLLQRKEHPPQYREIHLMKKRLLETLTEIEIKDFNTLTMRDYLKILDKVYTKKKEMFSSFLDSSPKFKVMIYWLLKKIYEDEEIPESFFDTELMALFKKGDQKDPGNYRFLQLKKDIPRLFEMAVYVKLEKTYDAKTPESQAGSKKDSDTLEHLVMLISALNEAVLKGKGLICTFNDIVKCFDRLFLSDSHWFLDVIFLT